MYAKSNAISGNHKVKRKKGERKRDKQKKEEEERKGGEEAKQQIKKSLRKEIFIDECQYVACMPSRTSKANASLNFKGKPKTLFIRSNIVIP